LKIKKTVLFLLLSVFISLIAVIFIIKKPSGQSELKAETSPSISDETSFLISNDITYPAYVQSQNTDAPDLRPFPAKGIPVLMYHSISTNPKDGNCVSEEQFEKEMEWLYSQNYHTLNMDELYQALVQGALVPDKPILITFDDGYPDNYKTAWPILKQYGFRATFFIITNNIGAASIDWSQLKDLISQGNSIGSHSVHHYDLSILSYKQQESELGKSKQILEDNLGIKIKAFCYPSGQYNETTLKLLSELGYTLSFTTKPGRVYLGDNQFELRRVRVWGGMLFSIFTRQVIY
jgi:peptidoglycan/xylan/chitin deacetylase (PgdA/CDA1 family)